METDYYDGRNRSKIVLSSDFECCHKYKHTLPDHVELLGGSESNDKLRTVSVKSKHTSSSETLRAQSIISSKSEAGSEQSKEYSDTQEKADELVEETYSEVVEEEEEYESSICSEWIVLKPDKKRRRKKEVVVESSVSDLMGPAGARKLSPEDEMLDEESRPKNLIPSNFFKYKDLKVCQIHYFDTNEFCSGLRKTKAFHCIKIIHNVNRNGLNHHPWKRLYLKGNLRQICRSQEVETIWKSKGKTGSGLKDTIWRVKIWRSMEKARYTTGCPRSGRRATGNQHRHCWSGGREKNWNWKEVGLSHHHSQSLPIMSTICVFLYE